MQKYLLLLGSLLVVACGSSSASIGATPTTPQGDTPETPDGEPAAPRCTPCAGTCTPEVVRAPGSADQRLAVTSSALFHAGPLEFVSDTYFFSKELRMGPRVPGGTWTRAPFQPATPRFDLYSDGKDTVVVVEHDQATVLDAKTGTVVSIADLERFNDGSRTMQDFAVSSRGLYKREAVDKAPDTVVEQMHFFSFATKTWSILQEGAVRFGVFAADDTGLYSVVNNTGLVHIDDEGTATVLSYGLGKGADYVRYDGVVLGRDTVYVSGATATSGNRYCGGVGLIDDPQYLIRSVPKQGGKVTDLAKKPIENFLTLSLQGGDDTTLVTKSICSDAGLWVLPTGGTTPPKKLLGSDADKLGVMVAVRDGYAYFTKADGSIHRVCSDAGP